MWDDDREYNDDYATCERTYVTLCVYHESQPSARVTEALGLDPARTVEARLSPRGFPYPTFWGFGSEDRVVSRDSRRHIDWLCDQLEPRAVAITVLQADGFKMSASCYWVSRTGHGGPMVPALQMARLARLGLDLQFDIYFATDDEDGAPDPEDERFIELLEALEAPLGAPNLEP